MELGMSEKRAFANFDDSSAVVDGFRRTVRHVWHLSHDVLSNSHFGLVDETTYDAFEKDLCKIVEDNLERLDCVFLDLDFSGNIEKSEDAASRKLVGFNLGITIRRRWPQLPIIIVSRFTENEILRKGLTFDFDQVCEGIELTQMSIAAFNGMLDLAQKKRKNVIESFGDVPVSFLTGKNRYFRRVPVDKMAEKYAFVAMPFDTKIVSTDVWNLGIRDALSELSISAMRADLDISSKAIVDKIATYIFDSSFVVADLTKWNANVLYELGLAHASNKQCILIYNAEHEKSLPFDVRHIYAIRYEANNVTGLKTALIAAAESILHPKK
jgi:hypothetical protein